MAKTKTSTDSSTENANGNGEQVQEMKYGPTEDRVFKLSKGTEVAEKYDGVEVPYVVSGYGRTAEESWQNILARCGGDHIAAVDLFNSAFALALQKDVKGLTAPKVTKGENGEQVTEQPTATTEDLHKLARDYVGKRNQRKSGSTKAREIQANKQKASLLDQLLAGEITMEELQARRAQGEV